jgi:esterase/lipase superfamily enzyme
MIAHPPFRSEWLLLMALAVSACARAQSQPTSLVVSPLSSDMRTAMTGNSWKLECPVSLDDLAAVNVGQVVSSTQWNAEFASYQAIWKGMEAVRTLADKLVLRRPNALSQAARLATRRSRSPARANVSSRGAA